MKIISCENCGVVLDMDRIREPDVYDDETGDPIEGAGVWDGDKYVPLMSCPGCHWSIRYTDGDLP